MLGEAVDRAGVHVRCRADLERNPVVANIGSQTTKSDLAVWQDVDVVDDANTMTETFDIDRGPNASPAWMVKWKFSRCMYWNASR